MDANSRHKLLDAGWRILRRDDTPNIRIKVYSRGNALNADWRTLEVFTSKAARDRRFKELLSDPITIED